MANEQPAGYVCNGCGRMARDLEQDMQELKEGNFLSCCPERKMVPVYTRPAAPVEGLETVGYVHKGTIGLLMEGAVSKAAIAPKSGGDFKHPVVFADQAEALIAVERAKFEEVDRCHEKTIDLCNQKSAKIDALETDNSALTARVKEVSEDRDSWRRVSERLERDSSRQSAEKETLETQLAAARKALKPFAEIAGEPWADANGWTDAACQKDRIVDWFGPSAFLAARVALEGKP